MKLKKQFWFALVVCFLGFSQAQAQTSGTHGDFRWSLDNEGMLTVSGTGIIPDGQGPWATDMVVMAKTKAIVIEEGVTHIGRMAFKQMAHALSLTIPASVISIGEEAFRGLNRLERIYSLNPVAPIAHANSFMNAGSFAANYLQLYVPDDANAMNSYANALGWEAIELVAIEVEVEAPEVPEAPEEVIEVHAGVISWKTEDNGSLLRVSGTGGIADGQGPWATDMSVMARVETIVIEEGITHIGRRAFMQMAHAISLTLPASLVYIGEEAFRGLNRLERIYSLNLVAPIAHANSFMNAGSFAANYLQLYVPDDANARNSYAKALGWAAIEVATIESDEPEEIEVHAGNISWKIEGDMLRVSGTGGIADGQGPWGIDMAVSARVKTIMIEEGITHIGKQAFMDMVQVTFLSLPASVVYIGEEAFRNNSKLEKIYSLNPTAPLVHGNSFKDAGMSVDADLRLYVPIDAMNRYAEAKIWKDFSMNMKELPEVIEVLAGNISWKLEDNGSLLRVSGTGGVADGQGPWATDMSVMVRVETIVIEEGITHIGRRAFMQMAHALSLTLPASLVYIGEEAFRGLNRLERIYSLNPVAPIAHANSFMNAGSFAANELKLYVPADARSHYAEALVWKSMDMYQWGLSADGTPLVVTDHISWSLDGDVLTVSGKGVIPDDYSPWRADMSVVAKVRTIVIEEGITHIGDRTFMLMQATSLMLPASVISIGDEAFRDNRMIERIYSLNPVAPILHVHSLLNVGISVDALPMLYVLADAMSSYAEAEVWNSMTMSELSADGIPDGFDGSWSLDGSVLTVRGKGVIPDGYRPWALDLNVMNKVKTIRIEEGITRIGMRSFMNMMHVTSLTLPASVSHIDEDAFSGLVALKEFNSLRPVAPVAYEKSFTDAGRDADLKFYIPQGSMKNYAAASVWERFSLNEKFAHPGWEFSGSELTIMAHLWKPAEVWSMVDRAEVRSVVIKEDVFNAEIEASAFEGLVNLTSISIPANITKIGARAFAGTGLKEVSLVHLSVLNVANNSFDGLESAVLYVPESVLGAYKESAWKDAFEFIGVAGSSLRLGTEKVILLKGKTQMLTPTVVPELWMDRVVWTSSDSKVASVSNGIIEAKSSGEAVITATVYGIALPAVVSVSVVTNPSDATLKSLIVSGESLTVDNATFSYSHAVASSVTSVKIEPVANHATAKLSVEGAEELAFGDNEYTIKVVSEDNSQTAEYRLVVRRLSNDAALKSLVVLDGSMEISLDPAKTSHTIKVNHSEPVIRIKAESDAQATIKMLDQEASVGSASATIAIRHNDVVTIKVTAGDGTEKEYALVIDRARENDVTLSGIFVNGLPVEYDAEKDRYVGHVVWSASTVQLTAKASNKEEATVEGEGKLMLRKGENGPFVLTVTAADKTTKKSYEVYITRNEEASSDASLKSLDVNEGTLEPAFDMETTEYFVNVGKSLSISFTAVANHLGATVKADEKYLLTVGEQTIAILVEAEDGTEREYKLNVTRDRNEFSENPLLLNDLDVSVGTLYPSFSPEQFSYKVHVSSNTEKINIAVSQHPDASVSGEGLKKLGYGENEFVITVLSGMEEEIYNITVVRANPEGTAGKEITWMLSDGVLTFTGAGDFNDDFSYTEFSEEVREAVKEVVIEEGITSISKQAFMKFSNLTTVTLPESLKRIHEEAFSLSGLTSVILPEGLELLEGFAFAGCPKLVSVTNRSKTPLEIDRTVFTGENLEPSSATLRVPAGFETAYAEAEGWKDLKIEYIDIDWSVEGTMLYIHGNGESARMLNYSDEEDGKRAPWYKKGSQITTIIVEGNVENIGDYAFYGFTNLTAILLPNSLTEIGEYAFRGNNLKFLTLPSLSLTTIGKGAFYGNENLQSITIAEGVTTIAEEAFYGAKSLEAISIPESVTTIGARAFWGADQLSKVVFPTGLTYVGDEAFYGAIRLKNVSIAQNPNIVFGARVFYGSENLETIVNFNTNPSPVDPTLFDGVEISDLTLYVPAESLEAYMAAEVWKEFNVQPIDASFGTGISKVASSEVRIYSYAQKLYVNSPVSEQVNVYSITGSLLGSVKKSAGETSLSVRSGQILIVKGSSGWVKKVKI